MTSTSLVTTSFCRLQWFCWIIVCRTTVDWWLQFWTEPQFSCCCDQY